MKLVRNHRFSCQFLLLSVVLLSASTSHVEGQGKVDSLKQLLKTATGTMMDDIFYQLAYEVIDHDNKLGLEYATFGYKSALSNSDSFRIVRNARIKCLAFRRLSMIDSSLILATKILPIAVRNHYSREIRHLYNGMAQVYTQMGNFDSALKIYYAMLNLQDHLNSDSATSVAFNNIGFIYYKFGDFENALTYFLNSLALKRRILTNIGIEGTLVNVMLAYLETKDISSAEKYLEELINVCSTGCPDLTEVNIDFAKGAIYFAKGDLKVSKEHHLKSYLQAKQLRFEQFEIDNLCALFSILQTRSDTNLEDFIIDESACLLNRNLSYRVGAIKLYYWLHQYYRKLNDLPKAFYFQTRYIELQDSVYNEKQVHNLMKLESQFLERENKAKLENQAKVLELNDEIIKRQRILTASAFAVLLLLGLVVFLLYRSNRIKKRVNITLEEKVKSRTKELELNRDLLQRSLDENQGRLVSISKKCNESLLSVKGLCALCLIEDDHGNLTGYVEKIQSSVDQLLSTVAVRK